MGEELGEAHAYDGGRWPFSPLRWWVGLAREWAAGWHRGAWAVEPGGRRKFVSDHWYTPAAYELAAAGVTMLSSHGSATFEFDAPPS